MLTHTQACLYCHQDFVPVRRGTQKHCSASCRVSYCRKKKQGTLHRLKHLPGPAGARASFGELYLAATAGSLTANTVTQTAEYYLVLKGMQAQLTQLHQQLVHEQAPSALSVEQQAINDAHRQVLVQIQHDQQRLLQALGVPPEPAPAPSPVLAAASLPPLRAPVAAGAAEEVAADFGSLPPAWERAPEFGPVEQVGELTQEVGPVEMVGTLANDSGTLPPLEWGPWEEAWATDFKSAVAAPRPTAS